MSLRVLELASLASGDTNEDRAGACAALSWVIDGATDVVDVPLTGAPSDAAWLAAFLDGALHAFASDGAPVSTEELANLPEKLARQAATAFASAALRLPADRSEHPSASGLIVSATVGWLAYVMVGDCTLITQTRNGIGIVGPPAEDAGDIRLAAAIAAFQQQELAADAAAARAHVWPKVRAARLGMNVPGGYGVFSITSPPPAFIRHGLLPMASGDHALLATDGLMRLVDVFRAYDAEGLLRAARSRGLRALLREVREIEAADVTCRQFPRAKVSDDATGLLLIHD